ncbi:uncharacterized protein LOC128267173 [Anopheles cruzii]|uniref:uncharacterized protein LOC128267173 n=1 Tax=Anopheles cruzii TaxID=68878 RepID=UPI0022EC95D1|nr:uncharacterized protein LOC128267173 [Anopheles cruzii]
MKSHHHDNSISTCNERSAKKSVQIFGAKVARLHSKSGADGRVVRRAHYSALTDGCCPSEAFHSLTTTSTLRRRAREKCMRPRHALPDTAESKNGRTMYPQH